MNSRKCRDLRYLDLVPSIAVCLVRRNSYSVPFMRVCSHACLFNGVFGTVRLWGWLLGIFFYLRSTSSRTKEKCLTPLNYIINAVQARTSSLLFYNKRELRRKASSNIISLCACREKQWCIYMVCIRSASSVVLLVVSPYSFKNSSTCGN